MRCVCFSSIADKSARLGHGRGTPSIYRCHSTNVFLNHAQMEPETVQIDFEWARNLEHPHGGFNFCESCLILAKPGPVGAVSEFAFKISQSSVQLVDAMKTSACRAIWQRRKSQVPFQRRCCWT